MLTVHLRDIDPSMVSAWNIEFANEPSVTISCGSIFDEAADAIVSPANSFGYMDGGIDLVYSHYFGWELEESLKTLLADHYFGELPVGQAVVLPTNNERIPYLVSAPTMRVPSTISKTANVYLAFRAALIAVHLQNARSQVPIESILVPGLGTGIGEVAPRCAAHQMKLAYKAIIHEQGRRRRNAGQVREEHHDLLTYNGAP
jgi:O-acetyl-ADP-ribose deacetylase (regulator of RNase III)